MHLALQNLLNYIFLDLNRAATTEGAEGPTGILVVDNHDSGDIGGSNAIGEVRRIQQNTILTL